MLVINYSGKSSTDFTRLIVVLFKTCNYRLSSVSVYCQSFININPADDNWQEVSQNQKPDPVTGWSIFCLLKPGSLKNGPRFIFVSVSYFNFHSSFHQSIFTVIKILDNLSQNNQFFTCIFIFKKCKTNTPLICSRYPQCRHALSLCGRVHTYMGIFKKTHFILPTV